MELPDPRDAAWDALGRIVSNVDEPLLSHAGAGRVAGLADRTVSNWRLREPKLFTAEREAGSTWATMSWRQTLRLGATAAIVETGRTVKEAAAIAEAFSELGDADRDPGKVYETGITLLSWHGGKSEGWITRLETLSDGDGWARAFFAGPPPHDRPFTVVVMNQVERACQTRLLAELKLGRLPASHEGRR